MHIDLSKVIKALILSDAELNEYILRKVMAISNYYKSYGFNKAIIGLSGGIDSAVSAALAVRALGANNVIAYSLPYSDEIHTSSSSVAAEVAKSLDIKLRTSCIKDIVYALTAAVPDFNTDSKLEGLSDLGIGNACARARMMVLMHAATMEHALVLGTENKTEEILAYYTIGGDDTTHVEPIHDLYKVQIFQLAKALKLPDCVLNRAPSAELWVGQTDEQEIGATYEHMDNVLYVLDQGAPELLDDSPMTKAVLQKLERVKGKKDCPKKL